MKIKIQPKQTLILNFLILFVALVFLTLGLKTTINNIYYYTTGVKTNATIITIIDTEDEAFLNFRYTVNGRTFFGSAPINDFDIKIGDEIEIFYLKSNPEKYLYTVNSKVISYVFISICLPIIIIFIIKLFKYFSYVMKVKRCVQDNNYIKCTITDVTQKDKHESFNIIPYTIKCTDGIKEYQSTLIYDNLTNVNSIIGYNVNVYIKDDFYFIDIDSKERNYNNV